MLIRLLQLLCLTVLGAHGAERPNILFILADDLSYRNVSCYPGSYPWARTPNIDTLARDGVTFTRGYAGAWCMPSRVTLMTGRQQYGNESMRLDVAHYPSADYNPRKMPLWPQALRENGYVTGMIGKWHVGKDAGYPRAWDYQKVWNRCRYPHNAHAYYEAQLIETNGGPPEMVNGYPADFYTDWAVDFIAGKDRPVAEKPWFLWLCYGSTHAPFQPKQEDTDLFFDLKAPTPADIFPPRPGKPTYMQKIATWTKDRSGRPMLPELHTPKGSTKCIYGPYLSDWERQYQQTVTGLDRNIGRVLQALEKSGQRGKTLVVFSSDQGFAWGQHGFATKMAPYDANIRPPLLFSQPGKLPAGKVCRHPVTGPDIVSTLLAQTGIAEPWAMHGHDFSSLLLEPTAKDWPHGALLAMTGIEWGGRTSHPPLFIKHVQHVPWWVSFSRENLKYIRTLEHNEIEELYDLERDPDELRNLALEAEFRTIVEAMRVATEEELARTDAPFVKRLPPVFPLELAIAGKLEGMGSPFRTAEAEGKFGLKRIGEQNRMDEPPLQVD